MECGIVERSGAFIRYPGRRHLAGLICLMDQFVKTLVLSPPQAGQMFLPGLKKQDAASSIAPVRSYGIPAGIRPAKNIWPG